MSKFMVLLYDNVADLDAWSRLSADEIQQIIEQYAAWSERLSAQGKLRGGDKLQDGSGRVLRGTGAQQRVTDGPFSETKEVVGGYFIIEAEDYHEAVRLIRDCPHLEFGGTAEIRAVDVLAMQEPEEPDQVASGV